MVSRRTILKSGGVAATGLLFGGGMLFYSTGRTVAATFDAANVSIETDDGSVNYLEMAPEVTVNWDGFDTDVATVEFTWSVSTSANGGSVGSTPYSESVSTPTKDGSVSRTFETISLLSKNGGSLSEGTFSVSSDGQSSDTAVTITLDVTLKDASSNVLASRSGIISSEYTVTVTNQASTMSASGTANTGGG